MTSAAQPASQHPAMPSTTSLRPLATNDRRWSNQIMIGLTKLARINDVYFDSVRGISVTLFTDLLQRQAPTIVLYYPGIHWSTTAKEIQPVHFSFD